MAVSILKEISTELYVAVTKLKFYEGSDLTSSSSSSVFSPKAGFGRNQSPVRRPVWLWHTAF